MKKVLIIANVLFASATVWGMIPHGQNDNFGDKRKFSRAEESPRENQQPRKKSRSLRKETSSDLSTKQVAIWDVRDSKISGPSNVSDESLLPFRRSVLNLKPYATTPTGRKSNEILQIMSSIRSDTKKIDKTNSDILKLGGKFSNLTELSIDVSALLSISLDSLSFPALETLKIEGDGWNETDAKTKISQLISKCSETLKKFDISTPDMDTLPLEIVNCKNLQYLNIIDSSMRDIPDIVFELRKLKHLEFRHSDATNGDMKNLSPKISNLTNLEFLAITGEEDLKTLPTQIWNLKNLKTLILEATGLEELPKEIGKLENLNHLDLSACELKTLPAEIGKLRNLDFLNISNNEELKGIPPEVLNLFEHRLKATDEELDNLTFMRYLLIYKSKTAMNDDALEKFVEQNQKEVKMLKERRNNLEFSLAGLRFYTDADNEQVSDSESMSEESQNFLEDLPDNWEQN